MKSSDQSRGTSWLSGLQQRLELVCVSSLNDEGVWSVPLRQEDAVGGDTVRGKTMGQLLCCLLAALVGIDIEGEIDSVWTITEVAEPAIVEMASKRAVYVVKASLP